MPIWKCRVTCSYHPEVIFCNGEPLSGRYSISQTWKPKLPIITLLRFLFSEETETSIATLSRFYAQLLLGDVSDKMKLYVEVISYESNIIISKEKKIW